MRNKFNSKKVTVDGRTFDSASEAKHYVFALKPRLDAGEISNLQFQPEFRIEHRGIKICKYKADFSYYDKSVTGTQGQRGSLVVEDVKGFKTDVYRLKKKLVEAFHPGIKILEVSAAKYRAKKYSLPSQNDAE